MLLYGFDNNPTPTLIRKIPIAKYPNTFILQMYNKKLTYANKPQGKFP